MIESGDYINPSFNYHPRFNKPVLSYWAVAASYHVFGVSEHSERIPIALSAIVLIATAFGLGRAVGSYESGLLAGVILATSPRFLMFSRRIIIDMWITMFMALTLLFFVLSEIKAERTPNPESATPNPRSQAPKPQTRWLILMYVAAGLGVLTKGPVAVVLPALAFLIYLGLERRLGDLRRMLIPSGILIVAAIVLPWYVALYAQHGWVHIKEFFIDENVMRYTQPVGTPRRGFWFYVPVLLTDLFPWSFLLPAALVSAATAFVRRGAQTNTEDRVKRLLLVWIGTIVLFFTFSRTKQDLYIFSIVPAVAALVSLLLVQDFRTVPAVVRRRSWVSLGLAGAVLGTLGVALGGLVVVPGRYPLSGSLVVAILAGAGGGIVSLLAVRRRVRYATIALATTLVAMSWVFVLVSLPDFERYKPVAPLVDLIKQRSTSESRIGYYRFALPSMAFYMRRQVFEAFDVETLRQVFASGQEVYCLMSNEDYRIVKDTLSGPTYVLASRPLFDVKIRAFLEGNELPEIVLVSNRPQ